jgi:hypothetical protein
MPDRRLLLRYSRAARTFAENIPINSTARHTAAAGAVAGINRRREFRRRLHCMTRDLTLRIIIEQPPPGVDFGLQKGSGSVYETVQKQRSQGRDLVFEFQPSISDGVSDSMAVLGGPFVQGPRRQRFVYIDIGTYAGQAESCWSRRLKVPLDGIPPKFIAAGGVLEGRVAGTGQDGGPSCATPRDFEGWKPAAPSKRAL